MKKRVLLAEDDLDLGKALKQFLEINKFEVIWAKDGLEAIETFKLQPFDICVLDVMMPKIDGFMLSKKMTNNNPGTPFLFLTARKEQEDRIKGLRLGADDYIEKPFDVEELVLRIQNIIKRTEQQKTIKIANIEHDVHQIGNYSFDTKNLTLSIKNKTINLTEKEAQLIFFFYNNQNTLIPREDILSNVWGESNFFSGRSMDVFITRIRKLFKDDKNICINTVRGVGLEFQIKKKK